MIISLAALAIGTWAADAGAGRWLLARSPHHDLPLPPFGQLSGPRRERVVEQLAALERGHPTQPIQSFDTELGWTNRPGRASVLPIVIGEQGARGGRDYSPEPAEGVLRLACFGTSFVFGSEVADEETWCAQLEELDPRLEALNFGVGGYGTGQALLRMRRERLHGARRQDLEAGAERR